MDILYLGDIGASIEYLKDCLIVLGHKVTHHGPIVLISTISRVYDVIIVSDYPAENFNTEASNEIQSLVSSGKRFLMLGGWESFTGYGRNYFGHPLAELLPVQLQENDDRVNASQGLVLSQAGYAPHSLLDWQHPPIICGHNKVELKEGVEVLVWAKSVKSDGSSISLADPQPLVVKGKYNKGTVIACMTDLAPHWCGGLVDWGSKRLSLQNVEVGDMYVQFVRFLLQA
jgi:uncharacterized membrane protein